MPRLRVLVAFVALAGACGPRTREAARYRNYTPTLTEATLERSLALGAAFLLAHQKPAGNFDYEYDVRRRELNEGDNQVRQAGALWALTLIYQVQPSDELRLGIEKGLAFFREHSRRSEAGRYVAYPGDLEGKTGTVALVALSLIDFLRAGADDAYRTELDEYVAFLVSLRTDHGQFHGTYDLDTGAPRGEPSPYFDGEALLALVKAAKHAGHEGHAAALADSAAAMYTIHAEPALEGYRGDIKGFYQWGSMAYYELYTSAWSRPEYAKWTVAMALWMVDTHDVLRRPGNTAYAYEGIIHAYELARLTGDTAARDKLAWVIDRGLGALTRWQIWHSADPLALGGVPNEATGTALRIDVTQHQMHAVILALRYRYF